MENCDVWVDTAKNRLYVKVTSFLTDKETKAAVDVMLEGLEKLKPDFDFIGDLSDSRPATQESTKEFNRIYQAFAAKGVHRNIVVVKDKIMRMQLQRKAREATYKEEYAASIEEAERMLDNPE